MLVLEPEGTVVMREVREGAVHIPRGRQCIKIRHSKGRGLQMGEYSAYLRNVEKSKCDQERVGRGGGHRSN